MAYTKFTLEVLYERFELSVRREKLFQPLPYVEPSPWLKETLQIYQDLPLRTEKARSEGVVMPILAELSRRNDGRFKIFSGVDLNVDVKKGLNGETDFLLASSVDVYTIEAPIFSVVEAKKMDLDLGRPQCLAQLLGAQLFNEKHKRNMVLYGCVTTSELWQFIKLDGKNFTVDSQLYYTEQLPQLLGVMQWVVDQTPYGKNAVK